MNPGLTLTGLALSLIILWANLRPWWTGSRDPKMLTAFGQGALLGALATLCSGGLLGWLAGCAPGIANTAGDKVVSGATGSASSAPIARATMGTLTPEGALIVALVTAAVVFAWRKAGKDDKKRTVGGAFCGATLCITAGVAGALAFLPTLVNDAGAQLVAALSSGGAL
ncbi:hypothetical protein ACFWZY_01625 [Streptomyces sp. NPDC058992]|uniref:hypothetical protein n=1 Tax=Streptomyces sp. NPDC058992 TaxID=3346688 RepID=UPI0036CC7666